MAIRVQIRNQTTGTVLAFRDVPDAVLPRLQAVYGDAEGALLFMLRELRRNALEQQVSDARSTGMTQVQTDETATRTAFSGDFPDVT